MTRCSLKATVIACACSFVLALAGAVGAQVTDALLYGFSTDHEGWIHQFSSRYFEQSGVEEILDHQLYVPEGWDDATDYPRPPGADAFANGEGSFRLGLAMAGLWDLLDATRRWTDRVAIRSEDIYTHQQAGWPVGFEHHPDYTGSWPYGHYGSLGAIAGDEICLRLYNPAFSHDDDPVHASVFTVSGAADARVVADPVMLQHGWNRLSFPVADLADPSDVREVGFTLEATRRVDGELHVDAVTLDAVSFGDQRFLYVSPDTAWISEANGYETQTVRILYDDGGAPTPGVRGFHVVLAYPADCVRVLDVTSGSLLDEFPNHFESVVDEVAGQVIADWVILGATPGVSGGGSVCAITLTAALGQEDDDCCGTLDLLETECLLRDPDNIPLDAVCVDAAVSHDIVPPGAPLLASPSHPSGYVGTEADVTIVWSTTQDGGLCPVGMRGYYLQLSTSPASTLDPQGGVYDWFEPWMPDSFGYSHTFVGVADGTWYLHAVACDWLWNTTAAQTHGPFTIDTAVPDNVTALVARPTDNTDLSVDLIWVNPASDFAGVKIFRQGFGHYPEYDDDGGVAPAWPATEQQAVANGWSLIYDDAGTNHVDQPAGRDFYYYAGFAYDAAGNHAAATSAARDTSLGYWLGDLTGSAGPHVVDIYDVLVLSLAYNTTAGDPDYNSICDIGPTTDFQRWSRPTTDDEIEFEDLIVLAMNYENAFAAPAPRGDGPDASIAAQIETRLSDGELEARVLLRGNPGGLLGASVELRYPPNWTVIETRAGALWEGPEALFFVRSDAGRGRLGLDAAHLGGGAGQNGEHAWVRFALPPAVNGTRSAAPEAALELTALRARDAWNRELAAGTTTPDAGDRLERAAAVVPGPTGPGLHLAPNPTGAGTTLTFALTEAGAAQVEIYDPTGRLVRTVIAHRLAAGRHQLAWDGRDRVGERVAPGIYFCRVAAGDESWTRKLTILR